MEYAIIAQSVISLIAVLNPVGAAPIYLTLVADRDAAEARRIRWVTTVALWVTLTGFALAGGSILALFGISLASFRTGGGILILLMGISMLHGGSVSHVKHTPEEAQDAAERDSVAIVPLAIPMLAGPGSISTVIVFGAHAHTLPQYLAVLGAIVLCSVLVWLTLAFALRLQRFLGVTGIKIITRVMGLVLAAMAVEFMAKGLIELFPVLTLTGQLAP